MSDSLRNRSVGEPARLRAAAVNAMSATARAAQMDSRSVHAGDPVVRSPSNRVLVRNTRALVPRFGVLALDGPTFDPAVNLEAFATHGCFDGIDPTVDTNRFAIVQTPVNSDQIGEAIISGFAVAQVRVTDATADVEFALAGPAGGVDALVLSASGTAEVLWREPDGPSEPASRDKWAYLRLGAAAPSASDVVLGIVTAPSTDGGISASYTVDVYGSTIATLNDPPTQVAATALQFPSATLAYWRAEVVWLRNIGGSYLIQKFLSLPAAYTTAAGSIGLRLVTTATDNIATNFIVDVADVTPIMNGGANAEVYCAYDWGSYRGVGRVTATVNAAVKLDPSWTIGTNVESAVDIADILSFVADGAMTLASSQDTFSLAAFTNGHADVVTDTDAFGLDVYVYFNGVVNKSVTSLQGRVSYGAQGSANPAFWPGLPTLPVIVGGVDNPYILLVLFVGEVQVLSEQTTGAVTNKINPEIGRYRPLRAGASTPAGVYDVDGFTSGPTSLAVS